MPARPPGVYQNAKGKWYFKVTVGQDPLTGRRNQITRRGFQTMAEAARERREVLAKVDRGQLAASPAGLKVNELLDLYLDGMDADQNLALKTRFDYRQYADDYIRPYIGDRRVRDITPEVILAWQRKLLKEGGAKRKKGKDGKPGPGKPLSPNTVNRIRAPLSATFKLAVQAGMIPINPLLQAPRPKPQRKIPKYWSPEEARKFLALMEGDRTWPIWAFLLGSGLRIGELVSLRWPSVDLKNRRVRIVDFVSTLGYDMMPSSGKSRDAIRTDRPRRRARRRPAPAEGPAEDRALGGNRVDRIRLRLHQARRRSVPPDEPVPSAGHVHHRVGRPAADCARAPSHQCHPHAGQRCPAEGGGRAPRACRRDAVHEPLQPRDADDAA